jgi:hypothetical protein
MADEKDGYAYIGFELGCTWDEEHGDGVMMQKDRVIEIGLAATSFDSWVAYDNNGTSEMEQAKWEEANAGIAAEKKNEELKIKPWWRFGDDFQNNPRGQRAPIE